MRVSVGWLALLLLLTMSICLSALYSRVPTSGPALVKKEGFVASSSESSDLNIVSCPAGSATFVKKESGISFCCEGTLVNGQCNGRVLCALRRNGVAGTPSCTAYIEKLYAQKAKDRCPASMPKYWENTKTGVKGCSPRRLADGSGPASGVTAAQRCRIYATEMEERTRLDSCFNARANIPRNWPLAKFQDLFRRAGCSRTLSDGDTQWWRTQSEQGVKNDMAAYASLTARCTGTNWQHNFCSPGKCPTRAR